MTTDQQTPQASPLAEALPSSLDELLSRDPMGYQAQDRATIVAYLRAERAKWDSGQGPKKSGAGKAPAKARGTKPDSLAGLDLKALGLID